MSFLFGECHELDLKCQGEQSFLTLDFCITGYLLLASQTLWETSLYRLLDGWHVSRCDSCGQTYGGASSVPQRGQNFLPLYCSDTGSQTRVLPRGLCHSGSITGFENKRLTLRSKPELRRKAPAVGIHTPRKDTGEEPLPFIVRKKRAEHSHTQQCCRPADTGLRFHRTRI